jgi:hypothetical protein
MDNDTVRLNNRRERFDQITVNFYSEHRGASFYEREGQRSKSRANFKNLVARTYASEARDASNGVGVNDEVLSESPRRLESVVR